MKISIDWLKDYVKTNLSVEEISSILTDTGLEVEKQEQVEEIQGGLDGLVVGEVIEKWQHPNADRLNLTKVDIGKEQPLQIVCGASNIAKGQKVVVSTVGTTLYPINGEPFKIKKGKIRGETSEGMICAEDEIGLGKSHDGIMILDSETNPGTKASDYFGISSDTMIEIGLTPNRTDAMGHYGVARDLVVALKHMDGIQNDPQAKLISPENNPLIQSSEKTFQVAIEDSKLCERYTGVVIKNISVKESPKWLKKRLKTIGLEPINNVVDVTNYVLHEFGHPLHAFDLDKIQGGGITVKTHSEGTVFKTLDGEERKLSEHDLMICDNENNPMCIAGVFGGLTSGVSNSTTSIFLESAAFQPVSIRKSAKRHALNTDASFRFERGVDPDACLNVLSRAANMILELCQGEISGEIIDLYPGTKEPAQISFSPERCNALIGIEIPKSKMKAILSDLDFHVSEQGELFNLTVPKYRVDVTREADVVEEILRIFGYNNIPLPEKLNSSLSYFHGRNEEKDRNAVADTLSSRGFNEMMSNSLTKAGHSEISNKESLGNPVQLLNPLSQELGELRTNLAYSMLSAAEYNFNRKSSDLKLYEFGNVYAKEGDKTKEEFLLGVLVSGRRHEESWNNENEPSGFPQIIGALEAIFSKMGVKASLDQKDQQLTFNIGKQPIATARKATPIETEHFSLSQEVHMGFINWSQLMKFSKGKLKFSMPSKFPEVRRDLSLLLDENVKFSDLKSIAKKSGGNLVTDVNLFDVYEGSKLPAGKKSYAMKFVLSDPNKTLNDKIIEKTMSKILDSFKREFNCELR